LQDRPSKLKKHASTHYTMNQAKIDLRRQFNSNGKTCKAILFGDLHGNGKI
jgi:hypothetical protein